MNGIIELVGAIALLVWVIGPMARYQYHCEQNKHSAPHTDGNDSASSRDPQVDPLASHPYYTPRANKRPTGGPRLY